MKLKTNFALPIRTIILTVYLVSIFASALGAVAIYSLTLDRSVLLDENTALNSVLSQNDNADAMPANLDSYSHIDIRNARNRIERINRISPIRGTSVNQLLSAVENTLPDGVVLLSLSYSAIDGQLHIAAETASVDSIYAYMKAIENNPMFTSPELQQKPGQGTLRGGKNRYEIHVVARPI